MIKKLLLALLVIIVIFVAIVVTRPDDFRVSRSASIAAPAPVVFEQVNNLKKWHAWSPWAKLDPNMQVTYSGPESGTGAVYSWVSKEVGEGRMTITNSKPTEQIDLNLEFLKPFEATNHVDFKFQSEGNRTNVVWSMIGKQNFVGKAMCLLMGMEKKVGDDFEKGLSDMKLIAEKEAASSPAAAPPAPTTTTPAPAPEPAPAPTPAPAPAPTPAPNS